MSSIINLLIYTVPAVCIAISLHEYAHGLVSYKLGDPTPKYEGRLSINPIAHIDWVGILCLAIFGFGWAKPVSVNARYYENQKAGMVKVALAGPLMNFFVAFTAFLIMAIIQKFYMGNAGVVVYLYNLLLRIGILNIGLGAFNLIPIPPLDGSKVLAAVLPTNMYFSYMRFEMYGMFLLILLLSAGILTAPLNSFVNTIINGMFNIINMII